MPHQVYQAHKMVAQCLYGWNFARIGRLLCAIFAQTHKVSFALSDDLHLKIQTFVSAVKPHGISGSHQDWQMHLLWSNQRQIIR